MKILGIDESGRGPVCGPLTMCGYLIDESKLTELKKSGAKDSKLLSASKREALAPLLKELADDYVVLKISAKEIDDLRTESNLNIMEIERMQQLINALKPDKVIIDSPEVNVKKFSAKVMARVRCKTQIVCENFADRKYPVVGAASIIAKVERDASIKKLHEQHGDFGSGYCHDEITIEFLRAWIKKNKEFPDFVRKSWFTAQWIKEQKEQMAISKFLESR
ncbi:MAG: ribonuclease HII [Candidatus Aenigmarchaeota archaeon]|nr:ribonuclease HII [Candidatus Aenigmarchaeota archaeon]